MSATPPQSTVRPDGALLLQTWRLAARTANIAHLRATDRFRCRNLRYGGLSSVLAALAGSAVLATFSKSSWQALRLTAGAVVVLSAIAAALISKMNYAQRSESHRHASRSYGKAVRQIQLLEEQLREGSQQVSVAEVRQALDSADDAAPNVPPDIWDWAAAAARKELKHPDVDASTVARERNIWGWLACD